MIAHANTRQLIEAWRLSRHGAELPARSALKPEALGSLLTQVFVLGREDGIWRFRLSGGFIADLFGRDLKGERFDRLWAPQDRDAAGETAERARAQGEPLVLKAMALSAEGRAIGLELTLAPATGPMLASDRMIGLVQPTGLVARLRGAPVWELRLAGRAAPAPAQPRLVVDNTR